MYDNRRTRFRTIRARLISALRAGEYRHEGRSALMEKNLLAVGELEVEDVIRLLQRCRGDQHRTSPHHADPRVVVHEFRPVLGTEMWYLKAYVRESTVWFISVHTSESR